MNLKLLFIIGVSEKNITKLVNSFKLPFNSITKVYGTATQSILNFFGLEQKEKYLCLSIIPDYLEEDIFKKLDDNLKIKDIGTGIGFTSYLTGYPCYIKDAFKDEGDNNMKNSDYELVLSIVQEGFSDKVMEAAKNKGATGGTLIKGHGIGEKNSFKFFNMTIEPERDIVLIVCNKNNKKDIMDAITEKAGIKTEGKGIVISLPVSNCIGIN